MIDDYRPRPPKRMNGLRTIKWTNAALCLVALPIVAWGTRLTWLEGVVHARERGFAGDFETIMFDPLPLRHWNGVGIAYGPLFVVERWLANLAPTTFSLENFWRADFVLLGVAFLCCVIAARLEPPLVFLCLGLWLASRYFYYSLAVAANPEILELTLLSL